MKDFNEVFWALRKKMPEKMKSIKILYNTGDSFYNQEVSKQLIYLDHYDLSAQGENIEELEKNAQERIDDFAEDIKDEMEKIGGADWIGLSSISWEERPYFAYDKNLLELRRSFYFKLVRQEVFEDEDDFCD